MYNEINEFTASVPKNMIRRLEEWPNAQPRYGGVRVHDEFVHINLTFNCKSERLVVYGFGQNLKVAKLSAAKAALQKLECAQSATS